MTNGADLIRDRSHVGTGVKLLKEDDGSESFVKVQSFELCSALNGEPALRPFTVNPSSDMKATLYLSNRGVACKTKEFFCTLCCCIMDILMYYNIDELLCDRGKQ